MSDKDSEQLERNCDTCKIEWLGMQEPCFSCMLEIDLTGISCQKFDLWIDPRKSWDEHEAEHKAAVQELDDLFGDAFREGLEGNHPARKGGQNDR